MLAEQALRERLARRAHPVDTAVALRLRGLDLRGDAPGWQGRAFVIVRGKRIAPDPEPGYLIVDSHRWYSSEWL